MNLIGSWAVCGEKMPEPEGGQRVSAQPTICARDGAAEPPGRGLRRVGRADPFVRRVASEADQYCFLDQRTISHFHNAIFQRTRARVPPRAIRFGNRPHSNI